MDWPKTGLGTKSAQGEQEHNVAQSRPCRPDIFHDGKVEGACRACQQGEHDEEQNHADVGRDEIGRTRTPNVVAIVLKGHQEERGEGHGFPEEQEQHPVACKHHAQHGCQ